MVIAIKSRRSEKIASAILTAMFGLGKKAIPLNQLADVLASAAIRPLLQPTKQDVIFLAEDESYGVDKARFQCEAAALQFFAVTAAINTHKLSGGLKPELASQLAEATIRAYLHKFENDLSFEAKLAFAACAEEKRGVEFVYDRVEQYATSENFVAPHQKIPEMFSQFCGAPARNGPLERIGWSIFIARGNVYIDILKKVKVV
ncbi:MAG: hypothetical protein ACLQDA_09905 [Terracidiphilus sp.]